MGLVHGTKEVVQRSQSQSGSKSRKSMKKKSTKKMASTKHKGLPNKGKK